MALTRKYNKLGRDLAIARYQPRPCGQQGGFAPTFFQKYCCQKCFFLKIFFPEIFMVEYFFRNISTKHFFKKIICICFQKYFVFSEIFCEYIFGSSIWSLRISPLVIKVPLLHIRHFEVKCDEQTH